MVFRFMETFNIPTYRFRYVTIGWSINPGRTRSGVSLRVPIYNKSSTLRHHKTPLRLRSIVIIIILLSDYLQVPTWQTYSSYVVNIPDTYAIRPVSTYFSGCRYVVITSLVPQRSPVIIILVIYITAAAEPTGPGYCWLVSS